MYDRVRTYRTILILLLLFVLVPGSYGQKSRSKKKKAAPPSNAHAVMWEKVNIEDRDLFAGPGGEAMRPDLSKIEFVKREVGGHNKKYRIKDGSGRIWVAKPFTEARPETAAVRLLWGLGYTTEINYLVPSLTIPGVGSFTNVRLEARPENIERLDEWKWKSNPFLNTNEFQGLKIMQIFMKNNDVIDINNKVLKSDGPAGVVLNYVISDLGSTFGKSGNNNLPLLYRFGRKNNSPSKWSKASFINGVKKGRLILSTKGIKNRGLYKDITIEQGRWLADLLNRLSDSQIRDAFRAANYSPAEIDIMARAFKRRVDELDRAVGEKQLAGK